MQDKPPMQDKLFIGIDVAKHWIDIAIHGGPSRRIDNTRQAIQAWLGTLDHTSIALVALSRPVAMNARYANACARQPVPFARVHPNEAAAFRTRRGVKAKTDRLDAGLLADFAALELAGRGLASLVEGNEALREMVVRRRQLVDTLHAERCRAGTAQASAVRQTLAQVIAALETVLAQLEAEIAGAIEADPALAAALRNLQTVIGVGPVCATPCLPSSPNSAASRARRSPPWSGSRRTPATAARPDPAPSPATAGPACAACCSTPPAPRSAGTRSCAASTSASPASITGPERSRLPP